MHALNLPVYDLQIRRHNGDLEIFDPFRKKYVSLTPEEWVRQNFAQYLVQQKNYPASLLAVEIGLRYNQLRKRADILIYNREGKPLLMVECKAPTVKISQDTFDQIAMYNQQFKVDLLVVTNGLDHFCCRMDYENSGYTFLTEIPDFA